MLLYLPVPTYPAMAYRLSADRTPDVVNRVSGLKVHPLSHYPLTGLAV